MNLAEFMREIADEDNARALLELCRWSDGVQCPKCESLNHSYACREHHYKCKRCGHIFSVTSKSALSNTNYPLSGWLLGIFLVSSNPRITSTNLAIYLGTNQKTAWLMRERIYLLMEEEQWAADLNKLSIVVIETDNTKSRA